jgi:hypothetical protein
VVAETCCIEDLLAKTRADPAEETGDHEDQDLIDLEDEPEIKGPKGDEQSTVESKGDDAVSDLQGLIL